MRIHALGLVLALASADAAAQVVTVTDPDSIRGFYAGAGVGSMGPFTYDSDYWYSDTNSGDDATSLSAFAGYRFNRFFAVEAAYFDASGLGWSENLVYRSDLLDVYNVDTDLDVSAEQVSLVGVLPFAGIWEVYARGGLAFWQADAEQHLVPSYGGAPVNQTVDDDGTGFLFGFGGGVTILQNLHARLEYQVFGFDDAVLGVEGEDATIDTLLLDLQYRFGGGWRH